MIKNMSISLKYDKIFFAPGFLFKEGVKTAAEKILLISFSDEYIEAPGAVVDKYKIRVLEKDSTIKYFIILLLEFMFLFILSVYFLTEFEINYPINDSYKEYIDALPTWFGLSFLYFSLPTRVEMIHMKNSDSNIIQNMLSLSNKVGSISKILRFYGAIFIAITIIFVNR